MDPVKVSVIVPVYNVEKYIAKNVESCVSQSLCEIEIIYVVDGSSDASGMILNRYVEKDDRIKVIYKKENEGVTIARNIGLDIASGEYILFLDADDYLVNNALEILYFEAHARKADFVVADFILEFPNGKILDRKFLDFGQVGSLSFLKYCFLENDFYYTGRLIRRCYLKSLNLRVPPEITFGEDNVAIIQLALSLERAIKVNIPVLYYVQRETSVTNQLKLHDLIQRGRAISFIIELIEEKGLYSELSRPIEIFALREIFSGIARGYVPSSLHSYLKFPLVKNLFVKSFSFKSRFFLVLASVNISFSIRFYGFLKKLAR